MAISYTVLGMGGEIKTQGTLLDLLSDIPYFLMKYIPPLAVVNTVLAGGKCDAGMSGGAIWKPFTVSKEQYESLTRELVERGLSPLDTPDWVITLSDWTIWVCEVDLGVPAQRHRELQAVCQDLERKMDLAKREGDDDQADRLHLEWYHASQRIAEYMQRFRKP